MELLDVIKEIQKKPASLFYGAGVCMECGGPSGDRLYDIVSKNFPGGSSKDFFEYMKEVVDFDNLNRNEIENTVRNSLASISPNDIQHYLFSIPWRAVLTTNYDRLPDLIPKTLDKKRIIIPVVNPDTDYPIDPSRPDVLYCFKLLGDVNFNFSKGGWMVLSSTDLKIAFDRRSMFFKMFHNLSSSGCIIYLGYSFRDNLVFDLLQEMRFILREIPWKSYAIMPEKPEESIARKMDKLGITWVKGTLQEFITGAKNVFGYPPVSATSVVNQFNVHNFPMKLERATVDNNWRKFKVFDVTMLDPFSKDPKHFFEGVDKSFYPFVANWDFQRKIKKINKETAQILPFDIKAFLNQRIANGNSSHNLIMSLSGLAGSGKTVVANRIAFDWYKSGNPVIFIDPETQTIDKNALDGLLDEIWEKYRSEVIRAKILSPSPLRYLLVADDCGPLLDQLTELSGHLRGIGKPVDILLVTRVSDLSISKLKRSNIDMILTIDDTIKRDEWVDFISHFEDLGVLSRDLLSSNLADNTVNTSFFALIFTTVRGVQKPLAEIVTEEFESLDEPSRKAYAIVSLLQSQILTPPVSLTLTASNQKIDWLEAEIEKGRLGGVLRFQPGGYEIVAANRVVADIIAHSVFRTSDQLYLTLKNVVKSVNLGNKLEMTLLHMLLTERLKGELGTLLKQQQKMELLKDAVGTVRSRPLLLHLAMLQMRSDKIEDARTTLREALSAHIPGFDEPEQHVIDAKGRLELRLGEKSIVNNKSLAWDHFEKAQEYFYDAQISPAATPHPYQGLGRTYINKAKIAEDFETRWLYLLLAMQECVYTEKYLGGDFNIGLSSLKKEVLLMLESEGLDEQKISRIRAQVGRGAAFAFLAEKECRNQSINKAFELVTKGLKEDPSSLWLIRLNVQLIKKKFQNDTERLEKALQDYVRLSDKRFDVILAFELAMLTFKKEDYRTAMGLFKELDDRTRDHPMRLTQNPENRWEENGELKEVFGVIIEAPTYGKYGKIECTSLSGFRGPLSIRRQDIEGAFHGGERVSFGIIFNMVGPQATRVRQIDF